ncbi:hypothetical protein QBC34DRAFT_418540 [Podospora aff. communis PSN243]|uniref:Uncharacterized protein n=1 Tax=Podospora aff. communis PSN243 TaxID=3040156 RepID=A0AAV9G511_9PEZI|nr:hypothetical protein QBC34DRAFT_418540 [Podospora aff. communis PSN243]
MDPKGVRHRVEKLGCSSKSECQLKIWTNAEPFDPKKHDTWLGEDAHHAELRSAVSHPPSTTSASPWILAITAVGDPVSNLCVHRECFRLMLDRFEMTPYISHVFTEEIFHLSQHTLFDEKTEEPKAVVLLLRVPRNSESVSVMMRINLHDMSSTFFVTASEQSTAEYLHHRVISERDLLERNPIYLLIFILEERLVRYWAWLERLKDQVNEIETVTDMVCGGWSKHNMKPDRVARLKSPMARLKQLHGSRIELSHLGIVVKFLLRMGGFCIEIVEVVEKLRDSLQISKTKSSHQKKLVEHVRFFVSRLEFVQDKVGEVVERLQTQVNVVYSHISQKDSQTNIEISTTSTQIASRAADDSLVMRTITILTLTFLPASLVAVRWTPRCARHC